MVNTRSSQNKRVASASGNAKPVGPKKAKIEPKPRSGPKPTPKAVRFSSVTDTKMKTSKHQSRIDSPRGRRDSQRSRRSPSPRRDFSPFPFVQSPYGYGHGHGYLPFAMPSPYYPNPFGFGGVGPHHLGKAHHKRRYEEINDSSSASDDDEWDGFVQSPVAMPAKRTYRAKSVSAAAPPTKPRGRPPKLNHTVTSGALNAVVHGSLPTLASDDDEWDGFVQSPVAMPAKRTFRAKSVSAAAPPPTKPRGRPPKLNNTVTSGTLQTPAKRTSRSSSASSLANRIQTPCMKPIGRGKFEQNPNCNCSTCVHTVQTSVPWMQSVPRFGVIDNHQRPIPDLNPIGASAKVPPSATVVSRQSSEMMQAAKASPGVSRKSDEMMQAQIKLNAQLMQRIDDFEAEKKVWAEEIKALQAASERSKKEATFFKAKFAESSSECNKLNDKLAKRKPDTNADSSANKENEGDKPVLQKCN
ncbi:uncharacterized protein LOC129571620 isoform X1 [Sitodiplosis mosellana]|uniref:uncharacterized protein LOC129571620 isoform X1 n=1 Tax=Sitodiplosis mosellana TaxID=263140 RepID=UPI0024450F54|nr:uncharacterized protein LOC129571620 isoform X1 [Sitodiplosis mosellana]